MKTSQIGEVPKHYDGSYVENHCTECNEYESECICEGAAVPLAAQALAEQGNPAKSK
jgi:hypothetical protein